jgi:hypothetical protein
MDGRAKRRASCERGPYDSVPLPTNLWNRLTKSVASCSRVLPGIASINSVVKKHMTGKVEKRR